MNDPAPSGSTAPPTSSQAPPPPGPTSYEDDEALARAIAASLNEEQARPKPKRAHPNVSYDQLAVGGHGHTGIFSLQNILAGFISAKTVQ